MLTDVQLNNFARRVQKAALRGYGVARGDIYAAELAKEAGSKAAGGSAAALLALCNTIKAKRAGKPVQAAQPAAAAKPAPAPVEEDEWDYSAWTKDDLYEEAKARDIEGRSEMSKADLIAALKADDAVSA